MKKLTLFWHFSVILIAFVLGNTTFAQDFGMRELLPTSGQEAEEIPHFPTRTAAFIWRNWNVVPMEALARTLDVDAAIIEEYARRLGLPDYSPPAWDSERSYITILRRNWSLLPYEQILVLLNLSPAQLAKKLREDDFFGHAVL